MEVAGDSWGGPALGGQGGPVLVEPGEDFWVDGIRSLDTTFVCGLCALCWEFTSMGTVENSKSSGCYDARLDLFWVGLGLEQESTNNLKAFLSAGRTPG